MFIDLIVLAVAKLRLFSLENCLMGKIWEFITKGLEVRENGSLIRMC